MKKKLVALVFGLVLCVSSSMLAFATSDPDNSIVSASETDNDESNNNKPGSGDNTGSGDENQGGGDNTGSGDDETGNNPGGGDEEDDSIDAALKDVLDSLDSESTSDEVNAAVEGFLETVNVDEVELSDETLALVEQLEDLYVKANDLELDSNVYVEVTGFEAGSTAEVKGAALAVGVPEGKYIGLSVTPETSTSGKQDAVAVDIDLIGSDGYSLTEDGLRFPVTITISLPTQLKNVTKIGIVHGTDDLTVDSDGVTVTFVVTHFSKFEFYDATKESGNDTEEPGNTDTNKPGSTDTEKPGTPSNPGTSSSSASTPNYYGNYVQSIAGAIAAAEKGSTVSIVTDGSVTLTSSVLRTLMNNPTVSLYLEYTYNGQVYKVLIPAGKAYVVEGIEYYGPLYLYSLFPYNGQEVITDVTEYTIVKGDTLSKIAKRNNTTVSELVKLNRIKNPNKIRIGQRLVLPTNGSTNLPTVSEK